MFLQVKCNYINNLAPVDGGISFILEATAEKYSLATAHDTELWEKL